MAMNYCENCKNNMCLGCNKMVNILDENIDFMDKRQQDIIKRINSQIIKQQDFKKKLDCMDESSSLASTVVDSIENDESSNKESCVMDFSDWFSNYKRCGSCDSIKCPGCDGSFQGNQEAHYGGCLTDPDAISTQSQGIIMYPVTPIPSVYQQKNHSLNVTDHIPSPAKKQPINNNRRIFRAKRSIPSPMIKNNNNDNDEKKSEINNNNQSRLSAKGLPIEEYPENDDCTDDDEPMPQRLSKTEINNKFTPIISPFEKIGCIHQDKNNKPWYVLNKYAPNLAGKNQHIARKIKRLIKLGKVFDNQYCNADTFRKEKAKYPKTISYPYSTVMVNEAALYAILMDSDQKLAIEFQNWVNHRLLPWARYQGCTLKYGHQMNDEDSTDEETDPIYETLDQYLRLNENTTLNNNIKDTINVKWSVLKELLVTIGGLNKSYSKKEWKKKVKAYIDENEYNLQIVR